MSPLHVGPEPSHAGAVQRRLWGSDPRGWAEFAEPHTRPLFEAMLDATAVTTGSTVLDVGCGTGLALQLAGQRGATVAGIDITPGLLEIAAQRVPQAELWCADMAELPWTNDFFDAVVGINAFQFASDPRQALVEAARVTKPGGFVGASLFAAPERSESTAIHLALAALSPAARQSDHAPYALSAPGNLESAFAAAGLDLADTGEVRLSWHYRSAADTVRGLLSSAGGTRAVEDVGVARVRAAIEEAVKPYTDANGEIELRNVFRWVAGRRPPR